MHAQRGDESHKSQQKSSLENTLGTMLQYTSPVTAYRYLTKRLAYVSHGGEYHAPLCKCSEVLSCLGLSCLSWRWPVELQFKPTRNPPRIASDCWTSAVLSTTNHRRPSSCVAAGHCAPLMIVLAHCHSDGKCRTGKRRTKHKQHSRRNDRTGRKAVGSRRGTSTFHSVLSFLSAARIFR